MELPEEYKLFKQVLHWYARHDPAQTLSICLLHLKEFAFFSKDEDEFCEWFADIIKLPMEQFLNEIRKNLSDDTKD